MTIKNSGRALLRYATAGGYATILSTSASTSIVECNPDEPFQAVETILKGFDYQFFHLRREGPVAVDKIVLDESGTYRQFFYTIHDELKRLE